MVVKFTELNFGEGILQIDVSGFIFLLVAVVLELFENLME